MAKILGKTHTPKVLDADTHSVSLRGVIVTLITDTAGWGMIRAALLNSFILVFSILSKIKQVAIKDLLFIQGILYILAIRIIFMMIGREVAMLL